jgi:gas vesicle protein
MNVSGFLSGALIGLVAGILLAPDKGTNTRENLTNTAEKWRDMLNRMIGKADLRVDDLRSYLDQNINGLTEDVKNRILTILEESEEMAYRPSTSASSMAGMSNGLS